MRRRLEAARALPATLCLFAVACAAGGVPKDIAAFEARREKCDHFRGEEPYDEARAKVLEIELLKHCAGSDAALRALRQRYAADNAVTTALSRYEEVE